MSFTILQFAAKMNLLAATVQVRLAVGPWEKATQLRVEPDHWAGRLFLED
jgi:hypothetical protein